MLFSFVTLHFFNEWFVWDCMAIVDPDKDRFMSLILFCMFRYNCLYAIIDVITIGILIHACS